MVMVVMKNLNAGAFPQRQLGLVEPGAKMSKQLLPVECTAIFREQADGLQPAEEVFRHLAEARRQR